MIWAFAALLLVQPTLEAPGTLRLVATGPQEVTWIVDGREVATTTAREATLVEVPAGPHAVVARTGHQGPWQVVVRLDRPGPGISYVPAWSAASPGEVQIVPETAAALTAAALVLAAWAQSKRP